MTKRVYVLGQLAEWLLPPMVSEVDLMERGVKLLIRTNKRYTIIDVDGVPFYFIRETGSYDGVSFQEGNA